MTTTPHDRPAPALLPVLPMAGRTAGGRSPVTCHLRCGDACAQPVPNTSANPYFRDVADAALSRRSVLAGALVAGAAVVVGSAVGAAPPAAAHDGRGRLPFRPIAPVPATTDALTVPAGYRWSPVVRWGDPLFATTDAFDPATLTPEVAERLVGYNCDYVDVLEDARGRDALLVVNHEYTNEAIMFPPATTPAELERQRRVGMASHGMSVVALRRDRAGRPWTYRVGARENRRVTASTPCTFDGPAAGSPLLRTVDDPAGTTPLGTLNNCAGGTTPWGTVLSGEENVHQYLRTAGTSAADRRYGFADKETTRGWEHVDPRFDARTPGYENEPHRFGWVVEVDPRDPAAPPVKHTALGRFKHEGANVLVGPTGHVAAYMGDDERFDYLYKFVSRERYRRGDRHRDHNKRLLAAGTLYVARFDGDSPVEEITGTGALPSDGAFDGTGEWVPLVVDGVSQVAGFTTDEVLVHTRLAADAVGATRMDRPEDVEPNPVTGRVYVACTNNTDRGAAGREGATEPNPRTANRHGHVIELTESGEDVTATTFGWSILLLCGDPATTSGTYFAGFPPAKVSPISCPDNLAFDSAGDLWISTDGQPGTVGYCDGLFKVPLTGRERGRVQQFLAVPRGAETCGPVVRDRDGMVLVAVQHPGEDGRWGAQQSYFPDYVAPGALGGGRWGGPRPSVVQVWRA